MVMRWIFWGFCRNWLFMSPSHYLSNRSHFGFEFAEIFEVEKQLPPISDMGSRRLRVSVLRGVGNNPHHRYTESPTPRITDTQSQQLPAPPIRRVGYWIFRKKTLCIDDMESHRLPPAPVIRWVANSPYCWVRESPTPCITDMESRRLCILLSQGVDRNRALEKPPAAELIPCRRKPLRSTCLLRDLVQTQVWSEQVWLNTTFFCKAPDRGIN